MRWRIKGLLQKTLSVVPGGTLVNDQLQRSVGTFRRFEDESDGKIEDFVLMVRQLAAVGVPVQGATLLEIGTGWYPTLPICLYVCGAEQVITFDLVRHYKPDLALRLVRKLRDRTAVLAEAAGLEAAVIEQRRARLEERMAAGQDLGAATRAGVEYRAPADATSTGLSQHAVDAVFSNSVLEHIPQAVLESIFAESWRVLRPGGVMFHSVNCGDHYAYTDPGVGQLHYLQFSDRVWNTLWNNALHFQNRLRAVDFLNLARKHDFEIVSDSTRVLPERLEELRALPRIAPEFRRYTEEELCLTTIDFIARKLS